MLLSIVVDTRVWMSDANQSQSHECITAASCCLANMRSALANFCAYGLPSRFDDFRVYVIHESIKIVVDWAGGLKRKSASRLCRSTSTSLSESKYLRPLPSKSSTLSSDDCIAKCISAAATVAKKKKKRDTSSESHVMVFTIQNTCKIDQLAHALRKADSCCNMKLTLAAVSPMDSQNGDSLNESASLQKFLREMRLMLPVKVRTILGSKKELWMILHNTVPMARVDLDIRIADQIFPLSVSACLIDQHLPFAANDDEEVATLVAESRILLTSVDPVFVDQPMQVFVRNTAFASLSEQRECQRDLIDILAFCNTELSALVLQQTGEISDRYLLVSHSPGARLIRLRHFSEIAPLLSAHFWEKKERRNERQGAHSFDLHDFPMQVFDPHVDLK